MIAAPPPSIVPHPSQTDLLKQKLAAFPPLEQQHLVALLEKYRKGQTTQGQNDRLAAAGVIERFSLTSLDATNRAQGTDGTNDALRLPLTDSYKSLSAALRRHFAGRINCDLSGPALNQWAKHLRGLPPGTPPPPAKLENRYDTQAWADWIEKWVLPRNKRSDAGESDPTGKDIFQLGDEAEARLKIVKEQIARKEMGILDGKYQPVETYHKGLREIGAVMNQRLIAAEKSIKDKLAQIKVSATVGAETTVTPALSPERCAEIAAQLCDGLRDELSASLTGAIQKTLL